MKNTIALFSGRLRRHGIRGSLSLALERVARCIKHEAGGVLDRVLPTGTAPGPEYCKLRRYAPQLEVPVKAGDLDVVDHRFDLLGSGLKNLNRSYDERRPAPSCCAKRQRTIKERLPADYLPLDWQRDLRSGFRWQESRPSKKLRYGSGRGEDIKFPWELGRLQHLPRLATYVRTHPECGAEIRNQILDFISSNQPRFGTNWICTMDVGIRAANLAMAVDLARANGIDLPQHEMEIIGAALHDHGIHIVNNLEFSGNQSSNHYLANICGLIFVCIYLPRSDERASWLAFGCDEFFNQLHRQFLDDGGNFEASTSYHRLSAEMVAYTVLLLRAYGAKYPEEAFNLQATKYKRYRSGEPAPRHKWIQMDDGCVEPLNTVDVELLKQIGQFTQFLLRKDGSVPLIGDEDSGRFFRLVSYGGSYSDLEHHDELVATLKTLVGEAEVKSHVVSLWHQQWPASRFRPKSPWGELGTFKHFKSFGLAVWRNRFFTLTLRAGSVGQNGNGGHCHCDQTSITLDVKGVPVIVDPGTGEYTSDFAARNRLRSHRSHSTFVVDGKEHGEWLAGRHGLFSMKDIAHGSIREAGESGATATHEAFGSRFVRQVEVSEEVIRISDRPPAGLSVSGRSQFVLSPRVRANISERSCFILGERGDVLAEILCESAGWERQAIKISPSYGRYEDSEVIFTRSSHIEIRLRA